MATEKQDSQRSPKTGDDTSQTEIDNLLGNARAALAEITSVQQSVGKCAADAELELIKVTEHLKEVEAKRETAVAEAATINSIADKSGKASSDIDDGANFIRDAKDRIATILTETSEFAAQAKERASEAVQLLESSRTLLAEITQKQAEANPLVAEIAEHGEKIKALITAADVAIKDANTSAESAKTSAATSAVECQNVEDGRKFIEERRSEAERFAADAKAKLDEATATAAAANAASVQAEEHKDKAAATLEETVATAAKVDEAMSAALDAQKATEALAKIADSVEKRVSDYEAKLAAMATQFDNQHTRIESLLPSAASAGLAAAFHAQKDKYVTPKTCWNIVFIVAIVGIAALGVAEIAHHWSDTTPNYEELLRSFLTRLPVLVALVWLAMHASGKSRIANQIQEDYTYKEAVSRSFEGYKKEFAGLPDHVAAGSPLATLCQSMVTILASSPSRVYDKHAYDPTPMSTFTEATKQLTELIKEANIKPKVEITAKT